MKRYRVLPMDFDFTSNILRQAMDQEWDKHENKALRREYESVVDQLISTYGAENLGEKAENLIDIGAQTFSVVSFHNRFYRQARRAFVVGAYYPALVSACALGERILNQLVLRLRESYKASVAYKKVARGGPWNNWELLIDVLVAWGVFRTEVEQDFRALAKIRNRTLHFDPSLESRDREQALQAIEHLQSILKLQFGAFGDLPWFIPGTSGICYISKAWENDPFIQVVYLPNAPKVGPSHELELTEDRKLWVVHDDHEYGDREVSDAEFVELLGEATQKRFEDMEKNK